MKIKNFVRRETFTISFELFQKDDGTLVLTSGGKFLIVPLKVHLSAGTADKYFKECSSIIKKSVQDGLMVWNENIKTVK